MRIVGYSDRLSVAPGERIRFHVSSKEPTYRARVVRLIHGDTNPAGPGFRAEPLDTPIDGEYEGREQGFESGSYVRVPDHPALRLRDAFTLEAWIFPTTPERGVQGLITKWSDQTQTGYGLFIDEEGAIALACGDGTRQSSRVSTRTPLRPFCWYEVSAAYDAGRSLVRLRQIPHVPWPDDETAAEVEVFAEMRPGETDAPALIAAFLQADGVSGHFNGKIERPTIGAVDGSPIAAWDFSQEISSWKAIDTSPNELHGEIVNAPMRAVTGKNWSGREMHWTAAPEEYGAIFFHDDDLESAGWEVSFELTVPDDMRSGIFAAQLQAGDVEDHVPFFVRPRRGTATAPIALLIPTFSYLAYANEHVTYHHPQISVPLDRLQPEDHYASEHRLMSLYDCHADGVGCCFASRLRPLVNMRPKYRLALIDAPHQLGADLHLIDWMEVKGFAHDVVTDEDLHEEQEALLHPYRVVVTGTHPEYWTERMLDGLERYIWNGGRLIYLGGNGFYWVTSVDPDRPHLIELRRGQRGSRPYSSSIGENYHATTGELGGLWRDRGRAPQRLLGIGHAVMGFGPAIPFHRESGSLDPRVAFIFEGVSEDEPIGKSGLVMGGAGGHELDRLDHALGTPPHAVLLASAKGFRDEYQHAVEEIEVNAGNHGGGESPFVRGDVVFFETARGGAVFSAGSMCWCGCLSHNDYGSSVSRITENVLRRFASDEPIPPPCVPPRTNQASGTVHHPPAP